jgi:hypothetical protein
MADEEFKPTPEELVFLAERRAQAAKPHFTLTQIREPGFFEKNKAEILEAAREGRLADDTRRAYRPPEPAPEAPEKPTFKRSQLADPAFYEAHKAEIKAALRERRVVEDDPKWQVTKSRGAGR